jgi:hypothetical protein
MVKKPLPMTDKHFELMSKNFGHKPGFSDRLAKLVEQQEKAQAAAEAAKDGAKTTTMVVADPARRSTMQRRDTRSSVIPMREYESFIELF